MNTTPSSSRVLIIGAGPVGLTLACELARHGVPGVRLVEKRAGRTEHSNALIVQVRTQEVLDAMGAHASFAAIGYPMAEAHLHAFGRRVASIRLDGVDSPHPAPLILPQHETERLLEEHLLSLGGRVERNVEAVRVEPDAQGVTVTLRHLAEDGREETVRTDWLAGCEGGGSLTRQSNGIPFEGERYEGEEFLMGDFTLRWGWPSGRMQLFIEAERTLMIFPFDARNDSTRVLLARREQDASNHAPPDLEEIRRAVREMTGDPDATLTNDCWRTRWRTQHRLAGRLRESRCLLAGDAGHIHPPVGGQGMNFGIQDAFNLGWKLAAVAKGEAAETLLASYDAERHATARALVHGADRTFHTAIHPGALPSFLLRHVAPTVLSFEAVQDRVRALMAETDIAYRDSPLTEDHGGHRHGPGAGERALDCAVVHAAGREPDRLFNVLRGTRWTLLYFSGAGRGELASNPVELTAGAAANVRIVTVAGGPLPAGAIPAGDDILLDYGGDLHARYGVGENPAFCLIRPDWYVGFRGGLDDAPRLTAYLQRAGLRAHGESTAAETYPVSD